MARFVTFGPQTTQGVVFGNTPANTVGVAFGLDLSAFDQDTLLNVAPVLFPVALGTGANDLADVGCIEVKSVTPRITLGRCNP
jgi:hypothetical protein